MARYAMKFGGTSVGSPAAIAQVAAIIEDCLAHGHELAVVVSAMSGVTDMLLESAAAAADRDRATFLAINGEIRQKHESAIETLITSQHDRETIAAELDELLHSHLELCEAVHILAEVTPRIADALLSFGERLSSRLIAAVMQAKALPVKQIDSDACIITDNQFGDADPIWTETEARITGLLRCELDAGIVPIITGFIGSTPDGTITTLGRGGSDYSAAIFAACLGLRRINHLDRC